MPESHQALLYDKVRNTHVLVEVGKAIDGFTVTEVEDDEVTMTGDNTSVILTAPAPAPAPKAAPAPVAAVKVEAKKDATPEDPYGEEKPREVEAPKVAEAKAPDAPKPIETPALKIDPAVAVVIADKPAVPDKDVVPAPPVADPTDANIALAKADVAAALADFGKLAGSVRGAQVANGIRIDKLAPTSMLAKVGLREGDIVTAIDGKPFRSIDDTADLYARAGGIKSATVVVLRNDKPLTLHVAIQ